jgi:hypothetical protein
MSRVKVTGMNAWMRKTESEKRRIKTSAQTYVRNSVKKVVDEVAKISPQFTGNYLFNWELQTTGHLASYSSKYKWADWHKVPNKLRMGQGENPAVGDMLQKNYAIINTLRYNSKVQLWNHSPVSDLIEQGAVDFRSPQNTKYDVSNGLIPYLLSKRGFGYLKKI